MTVAEVTHTRALEVLRENVERLRSSDEWRAALAVRSRLHRYSFNNVLLIAVQRPDASMVAGYRKWQELGRQVRKGERSIAILAPMIKTVTNDAGEKEARVMGFRTASVFDVSQTEGEPIPSIEPPALLDGDHAEADRLFALVSAFAEAQGSPITLVDRLEANGCYYVDTRAISVRSDLPPLHRLKTAVHEVAHALLHGRADRPVGYELGELEAESAAYLVASALGIDTSAYSFAYVAHYAGDAEALLASGEAATRAADAILAGIGVSDA